MRGATPFHLMQDEPGPNALYDVYSALNEEIPLFTTSSYELAQFVVGACNSSDGLMVDLERAKWICQALTERLENEGISSVILSNSGEGEEQ